MRISLIVTTYNWADALFLVLKSIKNQSFEPFEVIIADDGSNNLTKTIIDEFVTGGFQIIEDYQLQDDGQFQELRELIPELFI